MSDVWLGIVRAESPSTASFGCLHRRTPSTYLPRDACSPTAKHVRQHTALAWTAQFRVEDGSSETAARRHRISTVLSDKPICDHSNSLVPLLNFLQYSRFHFNPSKWPASPVESGRFGVQVIDQHVPTAPRTAWYVGEAQCVFSKEETNAFGRRREQPCYYPPPRPCDVPKRNQDSLSKADAWMQYAIRQNSPSASTSTYNRSI